MNKSTAVVLLVALVLLISPLAAQDRVDLIVLLDSSKSMFTYYNAVVDYVLSGTVREYLRFGDTFHLITFADSTTIELTRNLRTEQDLKSVIARLYLLYPLGRNTDLVTALKNVHSYVSGLPTSNTKYIILITDGMHSPAPGTPYADMDSAAITKEINVTASRIKGNGWILKIVKVPFDGSGTAAGSSGVNATGNAGSPGSTITVDSRGGEAAPTSPGSGNYIDQVANASGAAVTLFDPANGEASKSETVDLPRISFPADLGQRAYSFSIPVDVRNVSSKEQRLHLVALLLSDGTDILVKKVDASLGAGSSALLTVKVRLPSTTPPGETKLTLEPRFADGVRVNPARSTVKVVLKRGILELISGNRIWIPVIIGLVALASATVFLVAGYSRRAQRKTERPIVDAVIDSAAANRHAASAASTRRNGNPLPQRDPQPAREIRAIESTHTKDPALLLATGKHVHRDASGSADLLAEAQAKSSSSAEAKTANVLDSWKRAPASRLPLPGKADVPRLVSSHRKVQSAYQPQVLRPGAQRISLLVRDQNPNIGLRNIHTMHAGTKKSIGGGGSDFLVFLLPVPRHVAWAYYDGVDITIVPVYPDFFPDASGPLERCLGKDIRMTNAAGKELFLTFERYIPPIDTINRLLHCIEAPGILSLAIPEGLETTGPAKETL